MATLQEGQRSDHVEGTPIGVASKLLNVSDRNVDRAKKIKAADEELFEKVKSGEVSVNAALTSLTPKQDTRTRAEADAYRILGPWWKKFR